MIIAGGVSRVCGWLVASSYAAATALSWSSIPRSSTHTALQTAAVALICLSTAIWLVSLTRSEATPSLFRKVKMVVLLVGIFSSLALPMLTRDIQNYAAYARLAATGANPAIAPMPDELLKEFGLSSSLPAVYGPVWTYGTAQLSRWSAPFGINAELAVLKTLFVGCWVVMVFGMMGVLRNAELKSQIVGLAAISIAPISAFELVSESHNDVVVIALLVCWLFFRSRQSVWGPIALAAAALIKFVTAPLLAFAVLEALRRRRLRELGAALASVAVVLTVLGWLWSSGAVATRLAEQTTAWRWLSAPFLIELTVKNVASFSLVEPLVLLWRVGVVVGVLTYIRRWWMAGGHDAAAYAVLAAGMLGLLFSAEYLWPWYLGWALPFVILTQDRILRALAWPLFIVHPIAHAYWSPRPGAALPYRGTVTALMLWIAVGTSIAWIRRARQS